MHTTDAIVLGMQDAGEYDLLVSFYTREFGKLKIKARGAKKFISKQGAFLHEPSLVRVSFIVGRGGFILAGINSKAYYAIMPKDLFARAYIMSFLSLCDTLLYEGSQDEKLWGLLKDALEEAEHLVNSKNKQETLWRAEKRWLVALMDISGHLPALDFSRIKNRRQFDYYIQGLLQNKFERSITFFGLHAPANQV